MPEERVKAAMLTLIELSERVRKAEAERDALAAALDRFGPCPHCGGYGTEAYMALDERGNEQEAYGSCRCGGVQPDQILAARDRRLKTEGGREALSEMRDYFNERHSASRVVRELEAGGRA